MHCLIYASSGQSNEASQDLIAEQNVVFMFCKIDIVKKYPAVLYCLIYILHFSNQSIVFISPDSMFDMFAANEM